MMTTREKALLASSPAIAVLVVGLGWALVDRWQIHLADRGVRLLDRARDLARM